MQEFELEYDNYHSVYNYTLVPNYGAAPGGRYWTFKAPRPNRFKVIAQDDTYDLRVKDLIPANGYDVGYSPTGWASGFMFRHGITSRLKLDPTKYPNYRQKLQGILATADDLFGEISLPERDDSAVYKASFIKGYLHADGFDKHLKTSDLRFHQFFIENAGLAGIVLTGASRTVDVPIKVSNKISSFTQHQLRYTKGIEFQGFKVESIEGPLADAEPCYKVLLARDGRYVVEGGWTAYGDWG